MLTLGLAFGASVAWGASDFLGGLAGRRLPLRVVLLGSQAAGLIFAGCAWAVAGAPLPGPASAATAGCAGLAELAGFACLYRGLADDAMAVVAPLAALAALPPAALALASGDQPASSAVAGGTLALAGSAACAAAPGGRGRGRGVGLGLAAAACFGLFFAGLSGAAASAGPAAVLCSRLASVSALGVLGCLRGTGPRPAGRDTAMLATLGALDVLANLGYAVACDGGVRTVVAVLGSLYPATTVLLSRAVLHERLGRQRAAGAVAVLAGVALLAAAP